MEIDRQFNQHDVRVCAHLVFAESARRNGDRARQQILANRGYKLSLGAAATVGHLTIDALRVAICGVLFKTTSCGRGTRAVGV